MPSYARNIFYCMVCWCVILYLNLCLISHVCILLLPIKLCYVGNYVVPDSHIPNMLRFTHVYVPIFIQVNRPAVLMSNVTLADFCPEIPPLGNQNAIIYNLCLNNALSLLQAMRTVSLVLNNEQCINAAIPFFCKAVFSLCSDDSFVAEDLEEECIHVRDNNCTIEWRILENIFNVPVPSCESFVVNGTLTFTKAPPLTCPDQFDFFCDSVCLPLCPDFSQYSQVANVTNYALLVVFELIGLIGGVITLIVCLLNRKKM